MTKLAEILIVKWGTEFIVEGQFRNMNVVSQTFKTYKEAIKEMVKMAAREEIRYETGIGHSPNWKHDSDEL